MLKIIELASRCYAVTDKARARAFYEGVPGLEPNTVSDSEHGKWTEHEFGPHALAIGSAPAFRPSPDGCTAALEVEDFEDAMAHLKKQDVKFRIELIQAAVCRMAMIFDPDGNAICIHKRNARR